MMIAPKKSLGQHFLRNERILKRIAQASFDARGGAAGVLEIGPGTGNLTAELIERFGRAAAVETDGRLIETLQKQFGDKLWLLHADAMKLDYAHVGREAFGGKPFALCANLPYYITSPLIRQALEAPVTPTSLVLLVQKEVALRLCAAPRCGDYGLMSVATQLRAVPSLLFDVAAGCFSPPPKVTSSVVRLLPHPADPLAGQAVTLARAAFAMRRKTLSNTLTSGMGLPREEVNRRLVAADIDPGQRAETLSPQDYLRLAGVWVRA